MDTPRYRRFTLIAITGLALWCGSASLTQAGTGFGTDFEAAAALAAETGRPLLVHFYADYCPPCRRMEAEVLHDPEFVARLDEMVVAVKVNTAVRPDLAQRFGVDRIPHDRLLSPSGSELMRGGGFKDKWSYLSTVQVAADRFAAVQAAVEARKPQHSTALASTGPQEPLRGLGGYCPVELAAHRKWTKGDALHEVEYKGLTYQLSSAENAALFRANPEHYAPQVLGCDPVVLAASHRAIPGRIDFGAFFDGKLYLFQTQESRTEFKKNPLRYVRIQHALDVSRIERTAVR